MGGVPSLDYNSDTISPQPLIDFNLPTSACDGLPTLLQAQLTWNNGTPQSWVTFGLTGHTAGDNLALALQVASPVTTSGVYPWKIEVQTTVAGSVVDRILTGVAAVVANGSGDSIAPGWGLSGVDQIVTASAANTGGLPGVLWVHGGGGTRFFETVGTMAYLSPPNDRGTLTGGGGTANYVYTAKDGTLTTFDPSGKILSVKDPHNLGPAYAYSGSNLATVTEPDGGVATFTYASGVLASIAEPGGRTVTLAHTTAGDGLQDLTGLTMPDGGVRTLAYDTAHRLTNDRWGPVNATFAYDATTKALATITLAGGQALGMAAAAAWGLKTSTANNGPVQAVLTDALAQKTTLTLDLLGRPLKQVTPDGAAAESWSRDFAGAVTADSDPLGRVTKFAYQYGPDRGGVGSLGDLLKVTFADGTANTFQYEATHHHVTVSIDERNNTTTLGYNTTGDLVQVTDALNEVTTYAWSAGLLVGMTDARGNVTTYEYDPAGTRRLRDTIDALNERTTYGYDAAGNATTVTDALGHVTTSTFDGMRRELTRTAADGGVTTSTYDALGDLLTVTDPLGHVTSYAYDGRGLQTVTTEAVGTPAQRVTQTAYDSLGRLLTVTDADGNVTSYGYDALGRQNQVIMGYGTTLASKTTMVYDAAGQLVSQTSGISTDPNYTHPSTTSYGYDVRGRQTTVTEAWGVSGLARTTTTAYDLAGNAQSVTDANGNVTSYGYDALNRQYQHVTGYGTTAASTATMLYDAAGNLLSQTTGYSTNGTYSHPSTTSYGYDALNRQNQVITGYGTTAASTATMLFDAAGNLLSETSGYSSNGTYSHPSTTSYGYDLVNRQNQVIAGWGTTAASTTTMLYDKAGNLVSQTTGYSTNGSYSHPSTTTYGYDALNQQTGVTEAVGIAGVQRTSTTVYDAAGNVQQQIDPLGHVTSYAFDALNRQTTVVQGYGTVFASTATMLYDAASNLVSETDGYSPTGTYTHAATTSYAYDALNQRTTQIRGWGTSLASQATMVYDKVGNLVSQTTGYSTYSTYTHPATTTYGYDALNRQVSETDAVGVTGVQRTVTTVYDAAGNATQRIDALANATTYTYDVLNRETVVQNPVGTATKVYDAASNLVNTIDANGDKSTFTYDALNRQTAATDPRLAVTTSVYDAASNRVTLTDPDANTTTFVFDALNRLTTQTDPLNHSATFAYDVASRLTSTTDRDGRVRNLTYDALDRQTGETWVVSGSTVDTVTYSYDAASERLTAADANGAYTMAYDVLGRLTSMQEPFAQTLTYSYDAASDRTQALDTFGGTTTSAYDALGRLTGRTFQATGQSSLQFGLTWTARDQLGTLSRYYQSGTFQLAGTSSYTYDPAMRLTGLVHKYANGTALANYTYTYDPGNRLTAEQLNGTTTSYSYDAASELTAAGTAVYGFDANGNRNTTGYQTPSANQLHTDGTWTYTYDNEGNLTKKSKGASAETWTYRYDSLNRLTGATDAATDGGTATALGTYVYDILGNRLETDAWASGGSTTVTRYAYDDRGNAWADLDGSNTLLMRRFYQEGVDQLVARLPNGAVGAWYLTDRQGSVRDLLYFTGASQLDHLDYGGFGNVTNETQTSNGDRYKYTGRELDSLTGLQYNRARFYDPATGRWISEDPIGFDGGDGNLYRYVFNAPTNFTDPTGKREADDRETERTKSLVDVSKILEEHVNQVIQEAWRDSQKAGDDAAAFVKRVYEALGANEPGSELETAIGKVSPVAKAGVWLDTNLKEDRNQIVKLTFAQSRYGDNALGLWQVLGHGTPWLMNKESADHGLAPTIRIKTTLMGTDKWEHFFQQGYWGFASDLNEKQQYAYGLWLEGERSARGSFCECHPDLKEKWKNLNAPERHFLIDGYYQRINKEFGLSGYLQNKIGIYGSASTGVISYADINANVEGFKFYHKLSAAYQKGQKSFTFVFSVSDYKFQGFNEQTEKNTFVNGVRANDNR